MKSKNNNHKLNAFLSMLFLSFIVLLVSCSQDKEMVLVKKKNNRQVPLIENQVIQASEKDVSQQFIIETKDTVIAPTYIKTFISFGS